MRGLLRVLTALTVLAGGFAAVLSGLFLLAAATGSIPSTSDTGALIGFATYYRVVLVKGLAPQLLGCAGLLVALRRLDPATLPPRAALPLAALAAFVPAAWLLAQPLGARLPALQIRSAGALATTAALMTGAVIAAWALAERLVRAPRTPDPSASPSP